MKKMILLLILALTASMAIDFTMTKEGLFVESSPTIQPPTSGIAPETSNPYLEPVNLPKCDAGNPEVQFIRSNADWSKINYSSKRIFCVSPGDYTSLKNIKITASGTTEKRRYIILNNGNDTHPAKLDKSTQLANFALLFDGASYWTLDRPCSYDNSIGNAYEFKLGSTNNIINRMYTNNIGRSVRIIDNSHNNTVQNSRLDTMTHNSRTSDMTAIEIVPYSVGGVYELTGTKIINNEIKNQNDGFHLVSYWQAKGTELNCEGTIVDSNDIYITSDIYTDGNGNYTPTGNFAYAENAIDIKVASLNPANPMVFTNNHFWGFRKGDSTNSNISDNGGAFIGHYGVKNIVVQNNYIFDSNSGIQFGDQQGHDHAISESLFSNNIIYECGGFSNTRGWSLDFASSDCTVEDNLIFKGRQEFSRIRNSDPLFVFQNNLSMDTPEDWLFTNNNVSSVIEYHPLNDNGGSYQNVTSVSQGYTEDYTFITDKFTNNPRHITLKNVVKSN